MGQGRFPARVTEFIVDYLLIIQGCMYKLFTLIWERVVKPAIHNKQVCT